MASWTAWKLLLSNLKLKHITSLKPFFFCAGLSCKNNRNCFACCHEEITFLYTYLSQQRWKIWGRACGNCLTYRVNEFFKTHRSNSDVKLWGEKNWPPRARQLTSFHCKVVMCKITTESSLLCLTSSLNVLNHPGYRIQWDTGRGFGKLFWCSEDQ